jgi:hypothetical protein
MIQQISAARYVVGPGEIVTITATLLNGVTPELLQVVKDGVELQNTGGANPSYQFTAGAAGQEDVVGFFCNFPGLDPSAEVDTQVQGAPNPGIVLKQGDNKANMMFDAR